MERIGNVVKQHDHAALLAGVVGVATTAVLSLAMVPALALAGAARFFYDLVSKNPQEVLIAVPVVGFLAYASCGTGLPGLIDGAMAAAGFIAAVGAARGAAKGAKQAYSIGSSVADRAFDKLSENEATRIEGVPESVSRMLNKLAVQREKNKPVEGLGEVAIHQRPK